MSIWEFVAPLAAAQGEVYIDILSQYLLVR